jgi:hypothetical protein
MALASLGIFGRSVPAYPGWKSTRDVLDRIRAGQLNDEDLAVLESVAKTCSSNTKRLKQASNHLRKRWPISRKSEIGSPHSNPLSRSPLR